jgi:peptidoglycan/LPS O-acetylase OafA/YrhL
MEGDSYSGMLVITFVTVWFGDWHWLGVEWTLSVELWGSMLVYLTVVTVYNYKNRYAIYIGMMVFFGIAQWRDREYDDYNKVFGFYLQKYYMVLFMIGLMISDLENAKDWGENHGKRPMEKAR